MVPAQLHKQAKVALAADGLSFQSLLGPIVVAALISWLTQRQSADALAQETTAATTEVKSPLPASLGSPECAGFAGSIVDGSLTVPGAGPTVASRPASSL